MVGLPANVQKARELILADLDAKSEKVTLKIDVPFSEHSHVIGKEGANIKKGKYSSYSKLLCVTCIHACVCVKVSKIILCMTCAKIKNQKST